MRGLRRLRSNSAAPSLRSALGAADGSAKAPSSRRRPAPQEAVGESDAKSGEAIAVERRNLRAEVVTNKRRTRSGDAVRIVWMQRRSVFKASVHGTHMGCRQADCNRSDSASNRCEIGNDTLVDSFLRSAMDAREDPRGRKSSWGCFSGPPDGPLHGLAQAGRSEDWTRDNIHEPISVCFPGRVRESS